MTRPTLTLAAVTLLTASGAAAPAPLPVVLTVDRIAAEVAVLEAEDGATLTLPLSQLPPDAREGSVLSARLEVDEALTRSRAREARELREGLPRAEGEVRVP